jgi:hypothetical protein
MEHGKERALVVQDGGGREKQQTRAAERDLAECLISVAQPGVGVPTEASYVVRLVYNDDVGRLPIGRLVITAETESSGSELVY